MTKRQLLRHYDVIHPQKETFKFKNIPCLRRHTYYGIGCHIHIKTNTNKNKKLRNLSFFWSKTTTKIKRE